MKWKKLVAKIDLIRHKVLKANSPRRNRRTYATKKIPIPDSFTGKFYQIKQQKVAMLSSDFWGGGIKYTYKY